MDKKLYRLGMAVYLMLFLFAIIFYKERTIFSDPAFFIFSIVRDGIFVTPHFRYGTILTQIFPVLGIKLSLSLNTILLIFSASFIVYYFICYLLCGIVFKNYKVALALLIAQVLFSCHSFYWEESELPLGLAYLSVCFAYISGQPKGKMKPLSIMLLTAAMLFGCFFHTLIAIPAMYVFAYFIFKKDEGLNKKLFYYAIAIFIIGVIIVWLFFRDEYDKSAMGGIRNFDYLFPHYLGIKLNRVFLRNWFDIYYWIPLCCFAIVSVFVYKKQWLQFIAFCGFVIGYLLLINVCYANANPQPFYIENQYLPLGLIIAIPFVFEVLPLLDRKRLAYVVVISIFITGAARIYLTHKPYTARLNWERRFLKENAGKKLLLPQKLVPMDTLMMVWGTPYEFWLLSTTETGKTASILISENIKEYEYVQWENKEFATTWGNFSYSSLPKRYFKFTDSVSHYEYIQ
jgi:hypothetical protein